MTSYSQLALKVNHRKSFIVYYQSCECRFLQCLTYKLEIAEHVTFSFNLVLLKGTDIFSRHIISVMSLHLYISNNCNTNYQILYMMHSSLAMVEYYTCIQIINICQTTSKLYRQGSKEGMNFFISRVCKQLIANVSYGRQYMV